MNIDLTPFAILGIVLVLVVLVLALSRKIVAKHEDDTLHLSGGSAAVANQISVAHKLDVIDRWGQGLTVIAMLYAVAIVVLYGYQYWVRASSPNL
jgi:hypothetical protein